MLFKDRNEAAELILEKLKKYRGQNPLVLGIPRGSMPMAHIIAKGLQGELNAIMVRKIPHPFNSELAIGFIGISGHSERNQSFDGINATYIEEEKKRQLQILKDRQKKFHLSNPDYTDRIAILVDDGIATGSIPNNFQSVGDWYQDFSEVTEQDVINLLHNGTKKGPSPVRSSRDL